MKGSSCKIFSESQQKWFDGEIVEILKDEYVTVRYGGNMEKDVHIDCPNFRIEKQSNQKEQKLSNIYYSEGMEVEVYTEIYSQWIRGCITNINHLSHSVDILLDSEQDTHRIGIVHIKGKNEQNQIRPKQLNQAPIKSILKISEPEKKEKNNNWFNQSKEDNQSKEVKPPEIKTKNSGSSSAEIEESKRKLTADIRKKMEELIAHKQTIAQKTKKRKHKRHQTPQYDIYTKEIMKQEYGKAFSGDEVAVADGILSEDDVSDDVTPKPTKKVTISATPKPFRKRENNKHDSKSYSTTATAKNVSFKEAKKRVLDSTKKRQRGRDRDRDSDDDVEYDKEFSGKQSKDFNHSKEVKTKIYQIPRDKKKNKRIEQKLPPEEDELLIIEKIARGAPLSDARHASAKNKKRDPPNLNQFAAAAKMRGQLIVDPTIHRPSLLAFNFMQPPDNNDKSQKRMNMPKAKESKYNHKWSQSTRAPQQFQHKQWRPLNIPQTAPSKSHSTDIDPMDIEKNTNWRSSHAQIPSRGTRISAIEFDDNGPQCDLYDSESDGDYEDDNEGDWIKPWIAILIIICCFLVLGGIGAALIMSLDKKTTPINDGNEAKGGTSYDWTDSDSNGTSLDETAATEPKAGGRRRIAATTKCSAQSLKVKNKDGSPMIFVDSPPIANNEYIFDVDPATGIWKFSSVGPPAVEQYIGTIKEQPPVSLSKISDAKISDFMKEKNDSNDVYCVGDIDNEAGFIAVSISEDGAVKSILFLSSNKTGSDLNGPTKVKPKDSRAQLLKSDSNNFLFSYSTLCALVVIVISVCLQTAYLYFR